jgi:hypothetical protein
MQEKIKNGSCKPWRKNVSLDITHCDFDVVSCIQSYNIEEGFSTYIVIKQKNIF